MDMYFQPHTCPLRQLTMDSEERHERLRKKKKIYARV